MNGELRVGIGLDAHAFSADAALVLGGVDFPGGRGLAGHSDGDVVAHALIDAVLGAAGLGDIRRATRSGWTRRPSAFFSGPTRSCAGQAGSS